MYRILLATITLIIFSCDKSSTAPTDCFGSANGTAAVDDCGVCAGGTTGVDANADKDCAGVCGGTAEQSYCTGCASGNFDCAGVCDGTAELSGCDNACNSSAVEDCAGVCGGDAELDCAYECNGGHEMVEGDCVCTGGQVEDDCGVCGGDGSSCGPPVCLLDCPSYEVAINCFKDECATDYNGLCAIMSSWGGHSCLSDCNPEELDGIMEFINECTECLPTNSCEELFETECQNCLDSCSELTHNSENWCLDTPSSENGCSDICPGN